LPGQPGNSAIAGHRTTYLHPFYDLNELTTGDPIYVTTTQGRFRYDVTQQLVVSPSDTAVVAPTVTNELTLTTCTPPFSATQRLVVHAALAPGTTPAAVPRRSGRSGASGAASTSSSSGLAGEEAGWFATLGWRAASLAAGIGVWLVARRRRRPLAAYAIGAVPLLVILFLFFENLSPLLPASF
jgi:sortase A